MKMLLPVSVSNLLLNILLLFAFIRIASSDRKCYSCDQNCAEGYYNRQKEEIECDDTAGELRGCASISRANDHDHVQTRLCLTDEYVRILGGKFGVCKIVDSEKITAFKTAYDPTKFTNQNISTSRLLEVAEGRLSDPTLSTFKVCACNKGSDYCSDSGGTEALKIEEDPKPTTEGNKNNNNNDNNGDGASGEAVRVPVPMSGFILGSLVAAAIFLALRTYGF